MYRINQLLIISILSEIKAAAFIITGGQDNIQHVAGEKLSFWSELGFVFGKFPFAGWSRGWYAEDTENNYDVMMTATESPMKRDIMQTILGAVEMAKLVKENNIRRTSTRGLKQTVWLVVRPSYLTCQFRDKFY